MDTKKPAILINSQYIKDLSMEIPHAPHIFKKLNENGPKIAVEVNIENKPLEENIYNVLMNVTVNGDAKDEKAFILELSYGAVVSLNIPAEHHEAVLMVEIPHMIYPFARQIVANTLTNAGLPALMLNPIDFLAMYQAKKQQGKAN
jgi:preprotein translocase subunit SecB